MRGFRRTLDLLEEPGHYDRTVITRPATARRLHKVRVQLRTERGVPNHEPEHNPAYYVDCCDGKGHH